MVEFELFLHELPNAAKQLNLLNSRLNCCLLEGAVYSGAEIFMSPPRLKRMGIDMAADELRIGFIGAGRMATALAAGLTAAKIVPASAIIAGDVWAEGRERFAAATGARVTEDNSEVFQEADVIFVAVKPQSLPVVLTEIQGLVEERHLLISILAGIPLKTFDAKLGSGRRLVRVMPNTPCLVGESASGFALGGMATPEDSELVNKLLSSVGVAVEVPERLLDAVTGLSGSGPAYAYLMIEALSDGGVRMGLPRDIATRLAAQTLLGAAKMVLETGEHPGALKDAVTSPGGTTIAGVHAAEAGGFRGTVMKAVEAATTRARELGD